MADDKKPSKGKRDGKERYGKSPKIAPKPTGSDGPSTVVKPTNDAGGTPAADVMAGTDGIPVTERHATERKEMMGRHVTEMKDMHKRHIGELGSLAERHMSEVGGAPAPAEGATESEA